ncbi:MAG TPA: tRNA (guanosine(37)-N1)-methyltransferase TrmD [Firmicutes bacterium]|nr:tRNA (guanosine(37)-N1)-methyltransferase TrmD [Bacillota bacterium]
MKTINILTLFPSFFAGFLDNSIVKRAIAKGAVKFNIINIRDYSLDRNHRVDDRPSGGGAGLIMRMEPVMDCLRKNHLMETHKILMSPKGHTYRQPDAIRLASLPEDITLICGHYEGIDSRFDQRVDELISIGDFILTGGEIAATAIADSITRLLPGAIAEESTQEESFGSDLLEYPQYTFPKDYEGDTIPEVLFSGDHEQVREFHLERALEETIDKRPDLLRKKVWTKEELTALAKLKASRK